MMAYKYAARFVHGAKCSKSKRDGALYLNSAVYHSSTDSREDHLSSEWYVKMFPKLTKLTHQLRGVDVIDGKVVNVSDGSVIFNDYIEQKIHTLKSLARVFIGSPFVQEKIRKNVQTFCSDDPNWKNHVASFSKQSEREPVVVNSLTKLSNFLNVTAQQRKVVRFTICPQLTEHRIWTGALEEILTGLKSDMDSEHFVGSSDESYNMGQQIISSCLKFLDDANASYDQESTSWMRPRSKTSSKFPSSSVTWEDVLDMFNDLIGCLKCETSLRYHVEKLESMKEGLSQIKDVAIDKSLEYKEAQHQESLVQKKLSKTLGHSSRCLFTLLLYYLYGYTRDIEVDLCGGISSSGDGNWFDLYMGRILTSDEEKMVRRGVKQLDRALGLYKFVWETAGMQGVLKAQGRASGPRIGQSFIRETCSLYMESIFKSDLKHYHCSSVFLSIDSI